jgi:CRISPR/Cas system CSM-associated protein Csm3 (group 7 of RAMP superfamily)
MIKQLKTRMEWNLTLRIFSPLHIGTNRSEAKSEIYPLMEDAEFKNAEVFVIPGSTLKGTFRSYIESIDTSFSQWDLQPVIKGLFGHVDGPGLRGRLWIGDAQVPKSRLVTKHLTPIDRLTHTPIAPLQIHSIRQGTDVNIKLSLENPHSYELGLMGLFLRALSEGELSIGSGVSRGMGRVKLIHSDAKIFTTQTDSLVTEDGISFTVNGWDKKPALLGKEYSLQTSGAESYQWMQFGSDELRKKLMKEVSSS